VFRVAVAGIATISIGVHAVDGGRIAPFSTAPAGADVPPGWEVTRLPRVPRSTVYRIEVEDGTRVLRADADASMAGLTHRLRADPARTPWLSWRWKVSGVVEKGRFSSKAGDDFAARVYVLFDYDTGKLGLGARMKLKLARALYGDAVPAAGLCYVWDAQAPAGTSGWSPFTDRLRVIVVSSGAAQAGQWVDVARDVAADFRTAFGEDAPPVSAIAVATDTDNTGGSVTAWYGDIAFSVRPPH
jgi:hypothetical protein